MGSLVRTITSLCMGVNVCVGGGTKERDEDREGTNVMCLIKSLVFETLNGSH